MHAFPKSTSPRLRNPGRPFLVMPAGNEFIRFSHTSDPRRLRHATGRWHIRVNQAISKRLGGSGSKLGLLIVIEIACVFSDDVNQDLAILYCSSVTFHLCAAFFPCTYHESQNSCPRLSSSLPRQTTELFREQPGRNQPTASLTVIQLQVETPCGT